MAGEGVHEMERRWCRLAWRVAGITMSPRDSEQLEGGDSSAPSSWVSLNVWKNACINVITISHVMEVIAVWSCSNLSSSVNVVVVGREDLLMAP